VLPRRSRHSPTSTTDAISLPVADIAPFKGIRYDSAAVEDLAAVMAPPYDVITEAGRDALEDASPYNIVRLVLGRAAPDDDDRDNRNVRARALLDTWQAAGVLAADPTEAFYIYEQRYVIGGRTGLMRGILAAVALDEPGAGGVLPHERTYDDIVADRLALLRATAANLDCVFCVYSGDGEADAVIEAAVVSEPLARFRTEDDGVEHLLWAVTDRQAVGTIAGALEKAQTVIADGHHRHRTAQVYRDERRAAEGPGPWDRQLMLLVDASSHGPALLPIHRVLDGVTASDAMARLAPVFSFEPSATTDPLGLLEQLEQRRRTERTYVLLDAQQAWWMTIADEPAVGAALPADRSEAWRDLDVSILHAAGFDALLDGAAPRFVHHAEEAAEQVTAGGVAFLLAAAPFEAVLAVAEAGDAMPQKSTFFIPKPKTGIVIRSLHEP